MKILPEDFVKEKYNVRVRLVGVKDAPFIVSLRSDITRTKYMITLDDDVEKQEQWIRDYKLRERKGTDYYLLYELLNGTPVCVNRISQISFSDSKCKAAGWIKKKDAKVNSMAIFILQKEIIFNLLGLNSFYSDLHQDNKNVLRYYEVFDVKPVMEKNSFLYFDFFKSDFESKLSQVKEQFGLLE